MALQQASINDQNSRYLSDSTNTNISNTATNTSDITSLELLLDEPAPLVGTFKLKNGATTAASTIVLSRYSRIVTISISGFNFVADDGTSEYMEFSLPLPITFRPSSLLHKNSRILDNNTIPNNPGFVQIMTNGIIRVFLQLNGGGAFTNSTTVGLDGIGLGYALS